MGDFKKMRALALLLGLAWAASALAAHGPEGPAGWISDRDQIRWCCGKDDCYPVPHRVRFDAARGWIVDGLRGSLHITERGFYWDTPDGQPWACQMGTAPILRCLILPRPQG